MSKRARRDEAARSSSSLTATGPLNVSIVTSPNSDMEKLLVSDLELIRSSILYADTIDLVSVGATMMRAVEALRSEGVGGMVRLLAALGDDDLQRMGTTIDDPDWRQYAPVLGQIRDLEEAFRSLPVDVPTEFVTGLRAAADGMAVPAALLEEVASDMLEKSGMNELWPAVRKRVVNLKNAAADTPISVEDLAWVFQSKGSLTTVMSNWQTRLFELLGRRDQRLLLDETVSGVVRELREAGADPIARQTQRLAAETFVGTGLLARLPAFPGVPVDELLTMREDLSAPLGRYRIAAQRLAVKVQGPVFSPDWDEEVQNLWATDVLPVIAEIEDLMTDYGLIKELGRSLNSESRLLVINGSALITAVATVGSIQAAVAAASAVIGSGVYAGLTGSTSARSRRKEARRNDLYYLIEVNRRLSGPRP